MQNIWSLYSHNQCLCMRRRKTITSGFIQLSLPPLTVQQETIVACCVYSHAFKCVRERKTHCNMIKTEETWLQLDMYRAACLRILILLYHLSLYRVVRLLISVYSYKNLFLLFHLDNSHILKQKQSSSAWNSRGYFLNENVPCKTFPPGVTV